MAMDLQPDVSADAVEAGDEATGKKKGKLPIPAALTPTRRAFLAGALGFGVVLPTVKGMLFGGEPAEETNFTQDVNGLSPEKALEALRRGNSRFVKMKALDPNVNDQRRVAVAEGQLPFAGIIGCVDSRVPPELVFDRGLGDLFVARVAGNIPDNTIVGSIEFGIHEFDIPLVLVLGHTKCGAVKATYEAVESGGGEAVGEIGSVVEAIVPAVEASSSLDDAITINIRRTVEALKESPVISKRIEFGVLQVVGALYDIETGIVDFDIVPFGASE